MNIATKFSDGLDRVKLSYVLFVVIFLYLLFLYYPTVSSFYTLWVTSENSAYSQGTLLFAVCAYLFYKRWHAVSGEIYINHSFIGIFLVISISLLWVLASIVHIQVLEQLFFVFLIYCVIWSLYGYKVSRWLAFPVFLMVAVVPIWDVLNQQWLRYISAFFAKVLVELSGISVYREGAILHVPAGDFVVEDNCTGLHQLVVSIPLALIFAYINKANGKSMAMMAILALIVSFIANVVRISIIVIAGQLTNMQHYFVTKHVTLGWALFVVSMAIFFFLTVRFGLIRQNEGMADNSQVIEPVQNTLYINTKSFLAVAGTIAALAAPTVGPAIGAFVKQQHVTNTVQSELVLGKEINGWIASSGLHLGYAPLFQSGDALFEAEYARRTGNKVYVYASYFLNQEQGREAVNDLNRVYDGNNWKLVTSDMVSPAGNGLPQDYSQSILKSLDGKRMLVWQWYYAAGKATGSGIKTKLYELIGDLTGQPGTAVIIVATEIDSSEKNASQRLEKFVANISPDIYQAMNHIAAGS